MNRDQLRALQAPLKQRYREDPESALITLRADGSLEERVACSVSKEQPSLKPAFTRPQEGPDWRPAPETCFCRPW